MTSNHILFIPMAVGVGVLLGFILGARAARNTFDREKQRDLERAKARAEREARRSNPPQA